MRLFKFIFTLFGYFPRYRVEEIHTPLCGIIYYAQVKEWFCGRWRNIYSGNSDWARERQGAQWHIIQNEKDSRIPSPPLKTIYHYSKP